MKISSIDTYEGNPKQNENYYCFGREVVTPADGVVVDAVSSVPDNVPGKMNKKQAPGNYVVIDHGNNEYSMMAHFKENSVKVSMGQRVNAGDPNGIIGNSGNSSQPHLHYHFQNTPNWIEGEWLPVQFIN
jgi:murein DD-endopeptidase MepM/ murein hydrolase activator NlpD